MKRYNIDINSLASCEEIDDLHGQMSVLEDDRDFFKDGCERLSNQIDRLEDSIDKLKIDNSALKNIIEHLKDEVCEIYNEVNGIK